MQYRCVGEVRRLAAGGGHSAVLTDACSLKELCEFKLAEIANLSNAELIEEVASRTGADSLARLCEKLRYTYKNLKAGRNRFCCSHTEFNYEYSSLGVNSQETMYLLANWLSLVGDQFVQ